MEIYHFYYHVYKAGTTSIEKKVQIFMNKGISRRRNLTKNGQGSTGRVTVLGVNIYFPKYSNLNEESDLFFSNYLYLWLFLP